jgi:hypothetical protein
MAGGDAPFDYLLGLTRHRLPLINGSSGFSPPFDWLLNDMSGRNEFNDVFLAELQKLRAQLIIVHVDALGPQRKPVLDWLESAIDNRQLALLRRFDRGPDGDFVFGAGGAAGLERLRDAGRDAAGFTVRDNFERVRRNEAVFSEHPVVWVATPPPYEEMHRRLVVRGWATSPRGIRSVEVLLDGKRRLYIALLGNVAPASAAAARAEARAHVLTLMRVPFQLVIEKRPKGVPKGTDLQVRVTDGAGRVVHSEQRWIRWH